MTTYVPSYLRPISQVRTGMESGIDRKADIVEEISCPHEPRLSFEQFEKIPLWVNKQAYEGKTTSTNPREIRVQEQVSHPDRHWWIVSEDVLEGDNSTLRTHADIFDFLIALNICINDPVFFSQSPGQVVHGAYEYKRNGLSYRGELSPGSITSAFIGMNEIPEQVSVSEDVDSIYQSVRRIRSKEIETDAEADLRVSLHMYDDALSSDIWTMAANFYFVCENLIVRDAGESRDSGISRNTEICITEAEAWRKTVNRIKHPDKGNHEGILAQSDLEIPSPRRLRQAANSILRKKLNELAI